MKEKQMLESHIEHIYPVNKLIRDYIRAWSFLYFNWPEWVNYCDEIAKAHYSGCPSSDEKTIYLNQRSLKPYVINAKETRRHSKSSEPLSYYDATEAVKNQVVALGKTLNDKHNNKFLHPIAHSYMFNKTAKETSDHLGINEETFKSRVTKIRQSVINITTRQDQKL